MEHREIFWTGVTQPRGEWQEGCELTAVPTNTGLPDYLLRIWMEDASTGQPLTQVTVTAAPDSEVWSHVLAHPFWQHDPRPLIIDSIREVMWAVKLCRAEPGSPFRLQTGVRFRQGGTIHMDLTGEVLYESGGATVLQIVNYANTHLRDQLEDVFSQTPATKPTQGRIAQVRAEYEKELEARRRIRRAEQKRLLQSRPRDGGEIAVFMDESGDTGLKKPVALYTTTATAFDSGQLPAARAALRQAIADNWEGKQPRELHLSKVPKRKLPAVLSALASCLANHHGRVVVSTGQKVNFLNHLLRCEAESRREEERPVITHWADVLADPDNQTGRMMLMLLVEDLVAHVGVEALRNGASLTVCHDRKHRSWMNEALVDGFERSKSAVTRAAEALYGTPLCPSMSFELAHSQAEPCLWLSDWISWEVGRWARGEDLSPAFEECAGLMTFLHFDDTGRKVQTHTLGGTVAREFPDYPRDIQRLCTKNAESRAR